MYCQVIQNRYTRETIDFFDKEWCHQEFVGLTPSVLNAQKTPLRPSTLDTQLTVARELSRGIPFSRLDLYNESVAFPIRTLTF